MLVIQNAHTTFLLCEAEMHYCTRKTEKVVKQKKKKKKKRREKPLLNFLWIKIWYPVILSRGILLIFNIMHCVKRKEPNLTTFAHLPYQIHIEYKETWWSTEELWIWIILKSQNHNYETIPYLKCSLTGFIFDMSIDPSK